MLDLKKLPYQNNALEGFISEKLLKVHYEGHHQTYTNNLNSFLEKENIENKNLLEIFAKINSYSGGLKNNAGGYWNHTFFWESLSPEEKIVGEETLMMINKKYSSLENFKKEFTKKALSLFGSGWTWLVLNEKKELEIINTPNQENTLMESYLNLYGKKEPLLVLDIWEHSYYLDYLNKRGDYIEKFWNFINWDKVEERIKK